MQGKITCRRWWRWRSITAIAKSVILAGDMMNESQCKQLFLDTNVIDVRPPGGTCTLVVLLVIFISVDILVDIFNQTNGKVTNAMDLNLSTAILGRGSFSGLLPVWGI
jgi:hypothetical protein